MPACEHITTWLTPFGVNHKNSLATFLPLYLILQAHSLIMKSIVPSTLGNYAAGLLCFTQFCDKHCIPEALHMPTSEDILTLFVTAKGAHKGSATTIKHWLLGLELWHTVNGVPWLRASALRRALKVTNIFALYSISLIPITSGLCITSSHIFYLPKMCSHYN